MVLFPEDRPACRPRRVLGILLAPLKSACKGEKASFNGIETSLKAGFTSSRPQHRQSLARAYRARPSIWPRPRRHGGERGCRDHLADHHLRLLQAASEAWDRCQQARIAVAENGLTFTDDRGMVRVRPEVGVERDSRTAFMRALREAGTRRRHRLSRVAARPGCGQIGDRSDASEANDVLSGAPARMVRIGKCCSRAAGTFSTTSPSAPTRKPVRRRQEAWRRFGAGFLANRPHDPAGRLPWALRTLGEPK